MNRYLNEPGAKEIQLPELFKVIKKRFWLVLLFTLLACGIAFIYHLLNKPTLLYQSDTNIIIGAEVGYRNTLQVIIRDTVVLEEVIKELKLAETSDQLANKIAVTSVDDTQVVNITVVDSHPERAALIANTTAKVFIEKIPTIMDFDEVSILSEARTNPSPINESNGLNIIVIAGVLGLVAGIGFIFLLDSLNDSVKSESQLERLIDVPTIGTVSIIHTKNLKQKKQKQTVKERRKTNGQYAEMENRYEQ
ncbi:MULTISPECIES: YveK family protein [Cytobacillus]|uniref:YveK family protein n=1 Tax=Cytobacillus TaxID=2675230 RepID=UPI002041513F|nr:Wzz/FepE/Etk N-terminal domain-containing protein [Cytobacillus kochii]MCM3324516.1 Wzz/FepE/Etk N-terminal domain-containing protein [Cytobacillus kochii]MCM3346909.1 Wzz/FepE/Etk N-terminal domain-containing protein [Cytobacillus kochii]